MKLSKNGILIGVVLLIVVGVALWLGLGQRNPSGTGQKQTASTSSQASAVKEFNLVAQAIDWELTPGKMIKAWAYNGQIPGPELRVQEGDRVRVTFKNELPVATAIHWHGVDVPNAMDGVPGVTQEPVQPGHTFVYEFIAKPAGTRFYHTHGSGMGDEAMQMDMGLSGAFIIEPHGKPQYDREYTLILDDWVWPSPSMESASQTMSMSPHEVQGQMTQPSQLGMGPGEVMENYNAFTINGKSFPATQPLVVKPGEWVRLRLINVSSMTFHPMHPHGHQFRVVATDGNPVPEAAQLTKNTITVMPGESYDIEFVADNPGTWLFHCHELHHADQGLATLVQYEH